MSRLRELIQKYWCDTADAADLRWLEATLRNSSEARSEFCFQSRLDTLLRQESFSEKPDSAIEEITAGNFASLPPSRRRIKVAASVIVLTSVLLLVTQFGQPRPASAHLSLPELLSTSMSTESSIWSAAARGDAQTIARLIRTGIDPDALSEHELTALHVACLFGQLRCVDALLAVDADTSLTDRQGNTAMHMAAFLGHAPIVKRLLDYGCNPRVRNSYGATPSDNVTLRWTPSLEEYYREVGDRLELELDLARIRAARPEIERLLASFDQRVLHKAPSVSLWNAASRGNQRLIRRHIEAGTNVNLKESFGGNTPLGMAIIYDHPESVDLLIESGADLQLVNRLGDTHVHLAAFFCRDQILRQLLNAGASALQKNANALTPYESVTMELDAEYLSFYRSVYGLLAIEFDEQQLRSKRPVIAQILSEHLAALQSRQPEQSDE